MLKGATSAQIGALWTFSGVGRWESSPRLNCTRPTTILGILGEGGGWHPGFYTELNPPVKSLFCT